MGAQATTVHGSRTPSAGFRPLRAWVTPDYLAAAWLATGYAALLPFFWAPPVWVTLLLAPPPAD